MLVALPDEEEVGRLLELPVAVAVESAERVLVADELAVDVGVTVDVGLAVLVAVALAVGVPLSDALALADALGLAEALADALADAEPLAELVDTAEDVAEAVPVAVGVGVLLGLGRPGKSSPLLLPSGLPREAVMLAGRPMSVVAAISCSTDVSSCCSAPRVTLLASRAAPMAAAPPELRRVRRTPNRAESLLV